MLQWVISRILTHVQELKGLITSINKHFYRIMIQVLEHCFIFISISRIKVMIPALKYTDINKTQDILQIFLSCLCINELWPVTCLSYLCQVGFRKRKEVLCKSSFIKKDGANNLESWFQKLRLIFSNYYAHSLSNRICFTYTNANVYVTVVSEWHAGLNMHFYTPYLKKQSQ